MAKKIRVGILFGGKSAEHEISIRSAKNVADAIDTNKYEVIPVKIEKDGTWGISNDAKTIHASFDVIFPILHGPFGEDGTVQGLLKLAGVPFVGAGVLGSAVGMDKDVMKRLLRDAGIPIGKYLVFRAGTTPQFEDVSKELGLPLFIKPANMGSSIGVSKVKTKEAFQKAVEQAFQFDSKILIEAFIEGKEIECAVLGNENPIASIPGELVVKADFYSYEAKYIDEDGMVPKIPAVITQLEIKRIQETAVRTFQVLEAEGLSRVDSFLTKDGTVFVNEINTMPGFTSISMYPKMFEASGISYSELIDRLITLAIERFQKEQKLRTSYVS